MKNKIENVVNIIVILLLPFMTYITISESPVNISFADLIFPLAGLLILISFRNLIHKYRWIYILYFLGIIISLVVSHIGAQNKADILSVPYMSMIMEIVKTAIVGGYFYIGYMFVTNSSRYKAALYTLSIGSIPVGMIAVGAYIYHLLDKPFFIERFMLEGSSGRVVGTFEDPNLYAFYLIMIFYISLWNSKTIRNRAASVGMILISTFSIILLVMTMSRSGWIAFAGSLIIFGVLNIRHITKQSILVIFIVTSVLLVGISIDYSIHEGKIVKTVMDRIEDSLIKGNEVDRLQLTKAAFQMGNDNFLLGVGKGNFPLNSYIYLGEDNPNYKNQYIPHDTLVGFYAQQGILGVIIFLILPVFLLYKMIKSRYSQNRYMIPLFGGLAIQSFAINVENVRFLWFLIGIILASIQIDDRIEQYESKNIKNKVWVAWSGVLALLFFILYMNVSRYVYMNIAAYRGHIIEKTIEIPASGIYNLSFDIQTNEKLNTVEIYDDDKLLKTLEFQSAYGKVEEDIELKKKARIKFISSEEGWMKIRNAQLESKDNIIPIYEYPLIPKFVEKIMGQKGYLVYSNEKSFKPDIEVADKNKFHPIQIVSANVIRYSNASTQFQIEVKYNEQLQANYNLNLILRYDSIGDLSPNYSQRNNISHAIGAYRESFPWEVGNIYTIQNPTLLASTDFKLYGSFYNINEKKYYDEQYFAIPFHVISEEQEIADIGENNWVNIRYGKNESNQIVMSYNSWVESKRYNLNQGKYTISFKAQGSFLEEYSKIRIRDSHFRTIAELELDDTNKLYAIPYEASQDENGISFLLELVNYKSEKDVGNRLVLLEDWIKIEKELQ